MDLSRYFINEEGWLYCQQCGPLDRELPLSDAVSFANRHEWEAHRTG